MNEDDTAITPPGLVEGVNFSRTRRHYALFTAIDENEHGNALCDTDAVPVRVSACTGFGSLPLCRRCAVKASRLGEM